ncbi:MAG: helix-hairpin-helix domain-containing protein, partial [Chthoniobacterales bacterium]
MKHSFVRPLLITAFLFAASITNSFAHSPWITLQGGHYLTKRPNDGDSFHVSVEGHEYIFRLYFVDAPEISAEFRDRVEEQAKYFGVTVDEVLEVGDLAKQFTREKLTEPFLVRTCWEDAGGRSRMQRFYAFVQTRTGDLGEQLVENGLARSHPATAKPEGLTSAAAEWQKLMALEQKAKREKVGGWGANENRMAIRAQQPESEKGIDPFDKFFHPAGEAPVSVAAATPVASASVASFPSEETTPTVAALLPQTKLDVNAASLAELQNIPGIGPVVAQRIIEARPFKSADDLQRVK